MKPEIGSLWRLKASDALHIHSLMGREVAVVQNFPGDQTSSVRCTGLGNGQTYWFQWSLFGTLLMAAEQWSLFGDGRYPHYQYDPWDTHNVECARRFATREEALRFREEHSAFARFEPVEVPCANTVPGEVASDPASDPVSIDPIDAFWKAIEWEPETDRTADPLVVAVEIINRQRDHMKVASLGDELPADRVGDLAALADARGELDYRRRQSDEQASETATLKTDIARRDREIAALKAQLKGRRR